MEYQTKNQKVLFISSLILLIASLIYLNFNNLKNLIENRFNLSSPISSSKTSALIIDYGNGRQRMFEGPVTDNMDVFEAILAAKNGGGFNILYHANSNKEPVAISSIDEIESDPFGKKWYVYINNNLIEQGFDALSLLIETGDLIVLKYE